MKDDFDDFLNRFDALAQEAKASGIDCLMILRELDPISGIENRQFAYQGGRTLALGLATQAARDLMEPEERE